MSNQVSNQVIGLSLIFAKKHNLLINIEVLTDKSKIPLVSPQNIKTCDIINFSYFIVKKMFDINFERNSNNNWKALNIYYMKMLNLNINYDKKSKDIKVIPFIKLSNINLIIHDEFGLNLNSLIDCYNLYLSNIYSIKMIRQIRHDVSYLISFHYKDIEPLIRNKLIINNKKNTKEIEKINNTIKEIEHILQNNK